MKDKIAIACSGLGYIRRGLETFTEDLFHQLRPIEEFQSFLLKGAGKKTSREIPIWHLPRHSLAARIIAKITDKHSFYIQNVTFGLGMIPFLIKNKPAIIYIGEPVLYLCLQLWRNWSGQKFKMIFFTGGQGFPSSFDVQDILHHVTNDLVEKANSARIPVANQFVLPHFLLLTPNHQLRKGSKKVLLKQKLGLPIDSLIILSVGALDNSVKRMNYVIEEVSNLPESNYFLVLLGEKEQETETVLNYIQQKFPGGNFKIGTLSRQEVNEYYQAADVFVLASLKEGFGLVYLEALAAGLPVLAHDHSTAHFVLQEHAYFADFTRQNALASILLSMSKNDIDSLRDSRYQFVYNNYSWDVLKEEYLKMFRRGLS
jgi:1,2-diacylglycerol 3-alpha-glucosyltransferase